jgi:hypothetical protein
MMAAFWIAAKAFAGKALAFVVEHWRIVLPVLIVLAVWWCIHTLRVERDEARQQLADYQAAVIEAGKVRAAENLQKEIRAQQARDKVQSSHLSTIEKLRRQYVLLHERDRQQGEKDRQASIDQRDDLWRERLRLDLANASAGLPSLPEAAGVPAEDRGDGDTADPRQAREGYIENLEIGCAVTTADYNALMESWLKNCKIFGCK